MKQLCVQAKKIMFFGCVFELLQITCRHRAAALGLLSTDKERRDIHIIESDSVVMEIAIILGFSTTSCDLGPCKGTWVPPGSGEICAGCFESNNTSVSYENNGAGGDGDNRGWGMEERRDNETQLQRSGSFGSVVITGPRSGSEDPDSLQ